MSPLVEEIIREYGNNPFEALWFLFSHGLGLLTVVPIMTVYGFKGFQQYIWERYKANTPYVLYKVDVPLMHEQSMYAVEQIFVHLYGSLESPTRVQKYWEGFFQSCYSFEIVSDGGYITYYIRVATDYREMLEAAFYAQYPDALLTEVEDYSKEINPQMLFDNKLRAWGSELKLANEDVKPIRTWPNWEHGLLGVSIDPLAAVLEVMSRLQPGEKWWFQILAQPKNDEDFKKRSKAAISTVVDGKAPSAPNNTLDKTLDAPIKVLGAVHDQIWPGDYATPMANDRLAERQRLTEPERGYVTELDRKASRWHFKTKIRWLYFAPPKLYEEEKGRRGIFGALQQFRFINWFIEGTRTRVDKQAMRLKAFFVDYRLKYRARRMLWAYQSRDMQRGEHDGFIMTTEELASMFHFPQIEVRAPFVARATSRGVEPPTQLEYEGRGSNIAQAANVRVMPYQEVQQPGLDNVNVVPETPQSGLPQYPGQTPQAPLANGVAPIPQAGQPDRAMPSQQVNVQAASNQSVADNKSSELPPNLPFV